MTDIIRHNAAHPHVPARAHAHLPLALRREALLAQCALQRLSLAAETKNLLMPLAPSNLRATLGPRLKIPMIIAGAVLGLAVTRGKRALPILRRAASLLKGARAVLPVLPLVRQIAARVKK